MQSKKLPRYVTVEKILGETPLEATERVRKNLNLDSDVSLAYAGRLDPMASGTLLILIGDECKKQVRYHNLDKTYDVEILLGVSSDTADVLGILTLHPQNIVTREEVEKVITTLPRQISLPYPHFSSKTVKGKPLHTWTLEGKINEIEIPTQTSKIHAIAFTDIHTLSKEDVLIASRTKIESIKEVTELSKKIGADFRRSDVRSSWNIFEKNGFDFYQVLSFTCTASSGTYMRSLSEYIAKELGTHGIAFSIHRRKIGKYIPVTKTLGFWLKSY